METHSRIGLLRSYRNSQSHSSIEQNREEIREREKFLITEHFELHKLSKNNEATKEQLSRSKKRVGNLGWKLTVVLD